MSIDDDLYSPNRTSQTDRVLSVSELTGSIKQLLEGEFPSVWVSGEISNFSRPGSGHCYLTLKDDAAQIRAVLWRTAASRVRFELHDGLEVLCQGRSTFTPPAAATNWSSSRSSLAASARSSWRCGSCANGWRPRACSPPSASGRCQDFRGESPSSPAPPAPRCAIFWK